MTILLHLTLSICSNQSIFLNLKQLVITRIFKTLAASLSGGGMLIPTAFAPFSL